MTAAKTLIVYYSRTGNTKAIAELIQEKVGGELVQLETVESQPTDFDQQFAQNKQEQKDHTLPELKNDIPDFETYDHIFIGTPTWNMALPQAIVSFINQYDFTGKTVVPFNSNGGHGEGSTFDQIISGVAPARVLEGFSIQGGEEASGGTLLTIKGDRKNAVAEDVDTWLAKIK